MKTKQTKKHLVRVAITLLVALLCHVTGAWAQETFIYAGFNYITGTGSTCRSLIDGKYTSGNHSKWCQDSGVMDKCADGVTLCYWMDFSSDSPIPVRSYILTTADDNTENPGRNPKTWTVWGKLNPDDSWTLLGYGNDDLTMQDVNFTDYEFTISPSGSYQYFRIMVSKTQGSNTLQLEELRFRGTATPTNMACATIGGLRRKYQYTGSYIPLSFFVRDYDGNLLTEGTDFSVEIIKDNNSVAVDKVWRKGTYTISFRGKGSYSGVLNATFEVGDGSQMEFQIGEGTGQSVNWPINAKYNYCLTQQLYTGDEIGATGNITSIAFKNVGAEKTRNIDIYLVLTDKSSVSGANDWISVSPSDKVFSGEVTFITSDWTTITLDTPFAYDDSYNLAVIVDDNTGSYTNTTNFLAYETSKNQALYAQNDATNYDPENPPSSGTYLSKKNQLLLGMEIGDVGICPLPTTPTVGSITINSAMVSWAGRGDTWNLQYKAAAATDWTTVTGLTARSYTLSGLFSGIDYQVRVQTVCGADNTSPWVTTSFTTATIFQGAGTINNPWLITTKDDWDNLATEVAAGNTYEGEYLKMNADIGTAADPVTRMVGAQEKPFSGHFNGGGFTLTVNIVGAQGEMGAAPFSNIDGATIEGLTVKGYVKGNAFHAGGLVGCCGSNTANVIKNCTVEADVEATSYGGGIVGHGGQGNLTLQNCVYSGTITNNTSPQFSGGLLGWCDWLTFTIKNCLFKGAFVGSARYHPIALSNNGNNTNPTVSKALYLNTITATATGTNKVIAGAEGTPVSTTATDEYNVPIKAADGIIYYMVATGGVTTDVEIGDGGTGSNTYLPTYSYFNYSLTQQIYTRDEIGMAGIISAIAFKNTVVERTRNISIYMVETDKETFANKTDWEAISAEDLVFSGQVTFTVGEWTTIDLDAPFAYSLTSNLLVCVADNSGSCDTNMQHMSCLVFNASSQAIRSCRDESAYNVANPGVNGTITNVKNQLQLSITPFDGSFCAKPKLTVGDISDTGATLTVSGGSETYNVQYRLASATNWTDVATNSTDGTFTLTGLQPQTAYVARAQSVCSTDVSSEWREASFNTKATGLVEIGDGSTDSNTYLPTYSYYKYSLTQQIYTRDEIGMAGTISAIAFKNTVVERTRNISIYMVETDKATFANGTDWEAISEEDYLVFSGQVTFTVGEWTKIDLDAPFAYDANSNLLVCVADNSGTYDVGSQYMSCLVFNASSQAIRSYRDGSAYNVANPGVGGTIMNVKNQLQLSITPIGGSFCAKPKLTVGDITGTGATLTVSGGSETYNVQYRLASATNWTDVATNSTDGTFTLTGLQPLTAYVARAQSVCSTDASSEWREASFTTTAIPQEVGNSWSDDFEGSTCSWELINGSLENAWTWGTAVSSGGTSALYISNDGGSTNAYNYTNDTKVFAAKLLHFDEGEYQFSYDWLANGESNYDFLRVALVPASQTLTAGTDYTSIDKTNLPTGWIALDGGGKLNQASTWQSKSVTVSVRGTYYLVFAWRNDYDTGSQPPAAIDNVSILKQIAGDVDLDGEVTISDAIAVVNYILGNVPDNFNMENADVDGSTSITITDAVAIVDIVLHPAGN